MHGDGEIWAADAVGPADARSARPTRARLITAGHAAVAGRAVVPGHAQRDPAGRRGAGDAAGATRSGPCSRARGMGFFAAHDRRRRREPASRTSRCRPRPAVRAGRIDGAADRRRARGAAIAGSTAAIGGLENGPEALAATPGARRQLQHRERAGPQLSERSSSRRRATTRWSRPITVPDGGFTTLVAQLRRNWAVASRAARRRPATSRTRRFGCGVNAAIDQSPGTGLVERQRRDADDDRHAAAGGDGHAVRNRQHRRRAAPTMNSATRGITIQTSPTDGRRVHDARERERCHFNDTHDDRRAHRRRPVTAKRRPRPLTSNFGGGFRDLSEFAVYSTAAGRHDARPSRPHADADADADSGGRPPPTSADDGARRRFRP